ncbi:unnamed protein product [Polarella glacialis]|uniref:SecA family profile domain-containing protein n=1 Tax=Polarella glacialis TaxID=89957 RepID=A0A813FP26_POLGL|nr:unnamed protein product [Polarella glacialis]
MQIRTGEGKSIILGGCSVLFGLLGFRVRCVCYSEYLSQRDRKAFQELFDGFGLSDRVTYSRITTFSEDRTLAEGNLRELTQDLLFGRDLDASNQLRGHMQRASSSAHPNDCAAGTAMIGSGSSSSAVVPAGMRPQHMPDSGELLLVDEVDVFFSQDFYGKTHNQVTFLEADEVRDILFAVWELRDSRANPGRLFNMVKATPAFAALLSKFQQWHFLIETEVGAMCADLKDFDAIPYYYNRAENRIGYKIMDSIDYDVVFGYKTAFAYLSEASNQRLRDEEAALKEALRLRVPCGQFSYANLGETTILGVSGTVEALGRHEWEIMNRFGLTQYSFMPSVYGASNFRFLNQSGGRPITISQAADYFHDIASDINSKVKEGRAVIVFFKDTAELSKFESSPSAKQIRMVNLLQESMSDDSKDFVIKKAATAGQVTLATAVFGRGTDFFCNDSKLDAAGGVHVIQAFFSTDICEEVQMQGRTARQGKKGTYSIIINEAEVQDLLGISLSELRSKSPDHQYAGLCKVREKCREATSKEVEANLEVANTRDVLSRDFFRSLLASSVETSKTKFKALYEGCSGRLQQVKQPCRMMILSDATWSMSAVWQSTRAHIHEMLKRVADLGGDHLDLMWVAYRDYTKCVLLEASDWSSDPRSLQQFVNNITCGGGDGVQGVGDHGGEEAAEAALEEVRRQHSIEPVTRVLLIGDMAPHRESKGQLVLAHNHILTTDYREEAKALQKLGIPVYTFVVGSNAGAQQAFQYISSQTGAEMSLLTSPDKLIDVVCINALEEIGGGSLVAEYKARYQADD